MRAPMFALALIVLAACVSSNQAADPISTPQESVKAANSLLDSLTAEQKAKAVFAFEDKERLNWHYIPLEDKGTGKSTRKGLPIESMDAKQKAATMELLKAGTSATGYTKGSNIIDFEILLGEQEKGTSWTRNPGWYFVSIFGTPGEKGRWGWRIEGHHLALNYTFDGGKVVSASPMFFGTNPATVKDGPKKGYRNLAAEEDLARELFDSLDGEQKKVAMQSKHYPQIEGQNPVMKIGDPVGLAASKMTKSQQDVLMKLIQTYTERMPADVAKVELAGVKDGGVEKIVFGYSGGNKVGQPHTYRVQGPTFLIDFNCEQEDSLKNPGNHIHSVFRNLRKDFALDVVSPEKK